MLTQTKLSLTINEASLAKISALGQFISLDPNQALFHKYDPSDYFYVVVDGCVICEADGTGSPESWIGSGDFVGTLDFMLNQNHTQTVRANDKPCQVWRLHRDKFLQNHSPETADLFTQMLTAISWHIEAHVRSSSTAPYTEDDLLENHCDYWHPAIQEAAAYLKGDDDWETAIATWHFVQQMPYRFGLWNLKASETLALGYGMCTTKANLQVALLKANGLEASHATMTVPSDLVRGLLPEWYRADVRPMIKHFFAAVKLDGCWFPCDSSFTDDSLRLIAEIAPSVHDIVGMTFERGKPLNPASIAMDISQFAFDLMPDLRKPMQKKPFYSQHNVDAMNVRLDKVQGAVYRKPAWVKEVNDLHKVNANAALQVAWQQVAGQLAAVYG